MLFGNFQNVLEGQKLEEISEMKLYVTKLVKIFRKTNQWMFSETTPSSHGAQIRKGSNLTPTAVDYNYAINFDFKRDMPEMKLSHFVPSVVASDRDY